MKIAVLVFNTYENDARVEKAVQTYVSAGHEVRVVALAASGSDPNDGVLRISVRPGPSLLSRLANAAGMPAWKILAYARRVGRASDTGKGNPTGRRIFWMLVGVAGVYRLGKTMRWGLVPATGAALWLRWKLRSSGTPVSGRRPGLGRNALTLYRFAHRIHGYRVFGRKAPRALRAAGFEPDLVHANDFNTLLAAERLHDRLGIPFIYDSHELWSGRNRGNAWFHPMETDWELETERRIARKARAVVTVGESIARHLAKVLEIPEPGVIRNVPHASPPAAARRGLRGVLKLPSDAKLLVYTGKATYNRGLEEAIEALASLPPHLHLLVLGGFDARFKDILDAKIAQYELQDRFHHHGPVPSQEVPSWAAEGDLCLVPIKGVCLSYEFCLPNKLFEGIQAGLPILATSLVEMKRTLEALGCGLTYESGNVADLREKILHILTTPGAAEGMRAKAVEAARVLNWETEKARLLALLDATPPAARAPRA